MAKKNIYPGTGGRKNKVLKRPIDLTGIKKYQLWANVRWAKVRLAGDGPHSGTNHNLTMPVQLVEKGSEYKTE